MDTSSAKEAQKYNERVKDLAASLLNLTVTDIKSQDDGANSRVFQVMSNAEKYIMKFYFQSNTDERNRLETEFNSFKFLREQGIDCVPNALIKDSNELCAIYECIDGDKASVDTVGKLEIDAAVEFLRKLYNLNQIGLTTNFDEASEACFSFDALRNNIYARIKRLRSAEGEEAAYADLDQFINEDLNSFIEELLIYSIDLCRCLKMNMQDEILDSQKTLSPSDFGLHNAIRTQDGIRFIDFEYFGWDDPAKTIADFLLHPAMNLSDGMKQYFFEQAFKVFSSDEQLIDRLRVTYPWYALKWCAIFLNEFVRNDLDRREFAKGEEIDREEVLNKQLHKARHMLDYIKQNYREFPYEREAKS